MSPNLIYLAIRKRILMLLKGRYFVTKRGGRLYLLDILNYIDRRVEAYGIYERAQIEYFANYVNKLSPSTFFDIGANSGLYSIHISLRSSEISVVAFEPDPKNRAQLYDNLFLNDLEDRISVESFGISDQNALAGFHQHNSENRGRSMLIDDGERNVEVKTLDSVVDAHGQVLAFKIDVEGHEMAALRGGESTLKHNRCFIQVESFQPRLVMGYLNSIGYEQCHQIGDDYFFIGPCSGDSK